MDDIADSMQRIVDALRRQEEALERASQALKSLGPEPLMAQEFFAPADTDRSGLRVHARARLSGLGQ